MTSGRLQIIKILTLLPCATAVVLWAISYWGTVGAGVTTGTGRSHAIACEWGTFWYAGSGPAMKPPGWRMSAGLVPHPSGTRAITLHLFRFYTFDWQSDFQGRRFAMPVWVLVLITGLLPAARLVTHRRRPELLGGKTNNTDHADPRLENTQ